MPEGEEIGHLTTNFIGDLQIKDANKYDKKAKNALGYISQAILYYIMEEANERQLKPDDEEGFLQIMKKANIGNAYTFVKTAFEYKNGTSVQKDSGRKRNKKK
jgi:uncharacterized membrane protein YjdF